MTSFASKLGTKRFSVTALYALLGGVLGLGGCALPHEQGMENSEERVGQTREAIVGGADGTQFPEGVLIDSADTSHQFYICSGAMIAPRIVLTAGHCVENGKVFRVTAPNAGGQVAYGAAAATYNWRNGQSETVNPRQIDIGLLVLDKPIVLDSYPPIAGTPLPEGTRAFNLGRVLDGEPSFSTMFTGRRVALLDGARIGFPYAYVAPEVIESGDSGGPVFLEENGQRTIIAVNSGAGAKVQVLARTDLVADWIQNVLTAVERAPAPPTR